VTKKVTELKPKCPTGFKKKWRTISPDSTYPSFAQLFRVALYWQ
jgi:hypothetical protein